MIPPNLAGKFQDKDIIMTGWNDELRPHPDNWVQPDLYLPSIGYLADSHKVERDIGRIPSQIFKTEDYPLRPAVKKPAYHQKERTMTPYFAQKLLDKIGTVIKQFRTQKEQIFSTFWNVTDPEVSASATRLSTRLVPLPQGLSISVSDLSNSEPDILNDTTLPVAPGLEDCLLYTSDAADE